jgi:hypothetical protein
MLLRNITDERQCLRVSRWRTQNVAAKGRERHAGSGFGAFDGPTFDAMVGHIYQPIPCFLIRTFLGRAQGQ